MLLGDLIIWYGRPRGDQNAPKVSLTKITDGTQIPKGLTHVKASYNSVYGEIKSEWTKENDSFHGTLLFLQILRRW